MKFRTETEPEAIAEHLAERAEAFSAVRAIRIRCTLHRRVSDFFCSCFACTDL